MVIQIMQGIHGLYLIKNERKIYTMVSREKPRVTSPVAGISHFLNCTQNSKPFPVR